ncbi:MAG: hypothetical protein Q8N83_07570 [Ignavibacteria bacterium]|nr:hypothetical protein [Ignavibacteria bacterium]
MKYLSIIIFSFLLITGCGKKEETKLQAINPEAAAFDMGDGAWEVNASVIVKGFQQDEVDGFFNSELSYSVDLQKPDGSLVKNKFSDVMTNKEKEKLTDQQLNIQFELDSTSVKGKYKLVINIKDNNSAQTVTTEKQFDLGEE